MRLIARILIAIIANTFALVAAAHFIQGFNLTSNPKEIITVAAILTAMNIFIKPILKLVLGPIIILTLGLGLVVVNAILLKLLDFSTEKLSIENIQALVFATLIISVVNLLTYIATKSR